MDPRFKPCPHLPTPREGMDWSAFRMHGTARGEAFYLTALEYGHFLWHRGLPARAILCLDRALGADLKGTEPALNDWPLPYRAMAWFLAGSPPDVFLGNPRVHFQHLADRMNGPRREQRAARAWACWVLTRAVLPHLPGDPKHDVIEPTESEVALKLERHGVAGEAELWRSVVNEALASVAENTGRSEPGVEPQINSDARG